MLDGIIWKSNIQWIFPEYFGFFSIYQSDVYKKQEWLVCCFLYFPISGFERLDWDFSGLIYNKIMTGKQIYKFCNSKKKSTGKSS